MLRRISRVVAAATLLGSGAATACGGSEQAGPAATPNTAIPNTANPNTAIPNTGPGVAPVVPDLDGIVTIVAELGYPRDLLDRNRVNLVLTRPGDERFEIVTKQLRMTGYDPDPPERRPSLIPGGEQRVALQTRLGTVVDCDTSAPMAADLDVTFRWGDDDAVHATSLSVDDVATLDAIRTRHCTARLIRDDFDVTFDEIAVDVADESMTATLVFARSGGDGSISIETITGTVLVGVEVLVEPGARTLAPDAGELRLPVRFDVNRCDGHAVAETTRRYGVDLWVIVGDQESQRIPVDISPIEAHLAALVAGCQARTGSE